MFKVISLDIDGTIKGINGEPSLYTKKILNQCADSGAIICIATGRSLKSAKIFTDKLEMVRYLISFQGALITGPHTDVPLWQQNLLSQDVNSILGYFQGRAFQLLVYVGDEIYVEKMSPWVKAYGKRNEVVINEIESLRHISDSVFRVLAVGEDEDISLLESDMRSRFKEQLYITRSLPHFCEVLSNRSGKDKALSWICLENGYTREDVIAFGNGYNDVEMLKWAGRGVALKGSEAPAISAADDVAGPVDEEGVAIYLKSLLDSGHIGG